MFEFGRRSLVGVASVLALLVGCVDGRTASPPSGPARAEAEAEADGCLSVLIASRTGDARFTEPFILEGDQRVFIDPQPVVSCGSMFEPCFDPRFDAQRSAPGGRVLRVRLEAAAAEALRAATAHYDGKYAVFRWKGEVVSTPRIMSPLHDELVLIHEDQALLEEIAARIRLAPAS
jgi:hypothetical protein